MHFSNTSCFEINFLNEIIKDGGNKTALFYIKCRYFKRCEITVIYPFSCSNERKTVHFFKNGYSIL